MGDFFYMCWNMLDILNICYFVGIDVEIFNYKNLWCFVWGVVYKVSEVMKLKFGVVYDCMLVIDNDCLVWVFDNDCIWLLFGG